MPGRTPSTCSATRSMSCGWWLRAVDDDQVLDPAGHIQLPVVQEACVPGVQPPVPPGARGEFGVLVAAARQVASGHDDLADHALGQPAALHVHDVDRSTGQWAAVRHQLQGARGARRRGLCDGLPGQPVGVDGQGRHALARRRGAHGEGCLSEAVAGEEGFSTESGGLEDLGEPAQRLRADGLRPAAGDPRPAPTTHALINCHLPWAIDAAGSLIVPIADACGSRPNRTTTASTREFAEAHVHGMSYMTYEMEHG